MKILLTGANGYIGRRLIPVLIEEGHQVVALTRSPHQLKLNEHEKEHVEVITGDLLKAQTLHKLPNDIDAAYYLVHSMGERGGKFSEMESLCAKNFVEWIPPIKQVIYLSGLISGEELSTHLQSRLTVEEVLRGGTVPVTTLRAGIVIGSGSASFEMIRDLVEKLPVMVAPKWVNNRCQPIAIYDVLDYLVQVLNHPECIGKTFDIGGPDVLTYKEMMLQMAKIRDLKRYILNVPVLTPKLSAYWLYFVTSTNYYLARALIESVRNNAIVRDRSIEKIIPKTCMGYTESVEKAFLKVDQNAVLSSFRDSWVNTDLPEHLLEYIQVPRHGVLYDHQTVHFDCPKEKVLEQVFSIGGKNGWYYMDWAWEIRGWLDQFFLGVGLRRGRRDPKHVNPGDALDFWRVIVADEERGRLTLYAEMKVPGEAWLEFEVKEKTLHQTATFRPHGVLGRLYWYSMFPFHLFIFKGMARKIVERASQ